VANGTDPIHQFEVSRLVPISIGGWDLSFTNVSLFMVATIAVASLFLYLTSGSRALVPTRLQSISEMGYEFVASTLRESAGTQGMRFFPLVFSLFVFILVANFIGLFPYFYTVTSQIIITFALAMLVILTVVIYGFYKHGISFLRLFVPSGVPVILLPLVTAIEIISFLSRPTLKVFAGFCVTLVALGPIGVGGSVLPLIMTVAITALEFLVAFLQAYVFTVLTCMYLNDAVHPGH